MKNKLKITAAAVLCLALVFSLASCKKDYSPQSTELEDGEITLSDFYPYSGEYVEDGSGENVENVAALTVINNSADAWQLVRFKVMAGGTEYTFLATALMPGMTLTMLEENKKTISAEDKATWFGIAESGKYAAPPSKHEEKFKIEIYNGIMNLTNISDEDCENDVCVYFKNNSEGSFLGGITYRVNFGALKSGELSQRPSAHLKMGKSEILFVTYGK